MPTGLLDTLSDQDLSDLYAHLRTLGQNERDLAFRRSDFRVTAEAVRPRQGFLRVLLGKPHGKMPN